ncbi:hypothetical protein B0T24DRAFT_622746 [Lasiosphaeria ovina]|uniref:Secreted protein n=1 Tax=Lasiosphaeria ovina TaxID=92902 RepID=A0AAE0KBZ8_9PEZI|nr:hypothetical protein B0T24DRAFT_622746 [Lasiosphaeria ovina]
MTWGPCGWGWWVLSTVIALVAKILGPERVAARSAVFPLHGCLERSESTADVGTKLLEAHLPTAGVRCQASHHRRSHHSSSECAVLPSANITGQRVRLTRKRPVHQAAKHYIQGKT